MKSINTRSRTSFSTGGFGTPCGTTAAIQNRFGELSPVQVISVSKIEKGAVFEACVEPH